MGLSARGQEQARALASYVRRLEVQAVYASPMKRAQQTLAPLAAGLGVAPVTREELREVDFGIWTGLSWQEVHDRFQVHASNWLEELEHDAVPEAEGDGRFRGRVQPCLRDILAQHPGETVAVMCHGGVIRMVLSILLDLPLSRMAAFEVDYASLTAVDWSPDRTEIQVLNLTPWRSVQP